MTITENNIHIITVAVAETLRLLQENKIITNSVVPTENRELLSVREILELYPNLSEGAIREAINNRGLKFIQMGKKTGKGGKCLIDRKDLEEFLDKQKQTQVPIKPPVDNSKQININAILNKAV